MNENVVSASVFVAEVVIRRCGSQSCNYFQLSSSSIRAVKGKNNRLEKVRRGNILNLLFQILFVRISLPQVCSINTQVLSQLSIIDVSQTIISSSVKKYSRESPEILERDRDNL